MQKLGKESLLIVFSNSLFKLDAKARGKNLIHPSSLVRDIFKGKISGACRNFCFPRIWTQKNIAIIYLVGYHIVAICSAFVH